MNTPRMEVRVRLYPGDVDEDGRELCMTCDSVTDLDVALLTGDPMTFLSVGARQAVAACWDAMKARRAESGLTWP